MRSKETASNYRSRVKHEHTSCLASSGSKQQTTNSKQPSISLAVGCSAVCCLLFAVCLLRHDSQIPHQKRIDIRRLLDRLRRVAGSVARLRIDAYQDRVTSSLRRLKHRRILEIMRRHYSIVMIGGRYQGRRILRARLDVMNGRVSIERLKLSFVVARTVIRDPVPADRELVEAQHIHHARLFYDCLEQFRPLVRDGADQ